MSSGTFQSGWRGSEKVSLGVTRTVRKGLRPTSVVEAWVVGVGTTGCVEPAAPLPPSSCVKVGLLDFLSASRVAMLAKGHEVAHGAHAAFGRVGRWRGV